MAWPGKIPGGRVDDRLISSLDIVPTAAALAGARLPRASDGVNLMPYLAGDNRATPNPELYWRAGPNFAIRSGKWKMWVANKADPAEAASSAANITPDGTAAPVSPLGQHVMLYDLAADPKETRNVSAEHPEIVALLRAKLAAWDRGNVPAQWTSMRQSVKRQDGQLLKIYD
jgi:arylsulfatase